MTAIVLTGGAPVRALAATDPAALRAASLPSAVAADSNDRERTPGTKDQRAVRQAALRAAAAAPVRPSVPAGRPAPARASRSLTRAPLAPREIAKALLARRGWSGQYSCLNALWTKESNWQVTAQNRSSSAYGIPQSLPGSKMGSAGSDWRTNAATQITWGLGYIASRYGTPCAAWSHSRSHNWY